MPNASLSILVITILAALSACNPHYDAEACNVLSMKAYKGIPNSQNLLHENCKDIDIKYTSQLCQQALENLMMTNNLAETKLKFGDPVEHCFTGDDLSRFAKE